MTIYTARYFSVGFAFITAGVFMHSAMAQQTDLYRQFFDRGWNHRVISGDEVTLVSDKAYPCHVKAYGFVLLDTERRKEENDPWYMPGDVWQKWAWRVVVHNATDRPLRFRFTPKLISSTSFVLQSDYYPRYPSDEWIHPGRTEMYQNTLWYNTSEKSGEGKPAHLGWTIRCDD